MLSQMIRTHPPRVERRHRRLAVLAALVSTSLAAARPARAALGEAEASIARDRRALSATAPIARDVGPYRVHEFTVSGATVREYAGPDGVVFAVAWSGHASPELGPLLGAYLGEYRAAARAAAPQGRGRRQSRRVEGPHVIVDRWGHMRDWHGRAWLPDLLPAGVRLDDLQ